MSVGPPVPVGLSEPFQESRPHSKITSEIELETLILVGAINYLSFLHREMRLLLSCLWLRPFRSETTSESTIFRDDMAVLILSACTSRETMIMAVKDVGEST